ncbi:CPBP family intramembrane glutamic endopeptidase [Flavobacterium silvaticum]|uniref:CPBP family intramembrane metalloprotease n=1 Tax=Flavobacterium silvaticum TaxID=1852020 RepID=A0A972JHS7_9FLAO|nr:CPBP family intramembrane glutamic endopeptidase [Flavobacterium silvaticum]NMH29546.1 CPBP family intramembrane metalloprotease [Flavobacterium silvaticum]
MSQAVRILIIVAAFGCYYFLFTYFDVIKASLDSILKLGLLSYIVTYFVVGNPMFLATRAFNPGWNALKSLGLGTDFWKGAGFALLFALPMLLGGYFFFNFKPIENWENLVGKTACAGFFEELYFRGFLFGLLFRNTRLGFMPSVVFAALLFASGHLWQSNDLMESVGIFGVTFMGGVLFAWLFAEWNFNLWLPVFLHAFMNLAWELFAMDETALGGMYANIFRGLTIALAIIFTLRYKKHRHLSLEINRRTLWFRKKAVLVTS